MKFWRVEMEQGNNKPTEEEVVEIVTKFVRLLMGKQNSLEETYNKGSLCLSCKKFWKVCKKQNEKCYRGGSDGGWIRYCTGYEKGYFE
jgi:hypothetical protein